MKGVLAPPGPKWLSSLLAVLGASTAAACGGAAEESDPCAPPSYRFDSRAAVRRLHCLDQVPDGIRLISLEASDIYGGELDPRGRAATWVAGYIDPMSGMWTDFPFRAQGKPDPARVVPDPGCGSDAIDPVARSSIIVPDAVGRLPSGFDFDELEFQHSLGCVTSDRVEIRRVSAVSRGPGRPRVRYHFIYDAQDHLVASCGPCEYGIEECAGCRP